MASPRSWRRLPLLCSCLLACGRPEPTRRAEPSVPAGTDTVASSSGRKPRPSIAIVSPAGGNAWTEGLTYSIRWRVEGIDRVNVGVALGGKDKGHLALDLPASRDSLAWRIPPGFVSGFGIRRSDQMRLRIEDAADPTRFADSPPFTIVAPGQPSSHPGDSS
jgi:hypothetical protein